MSQAGKPPPLIPGPGPDQLSRFISQLNSYWMDNKNLEFQLRARQTQLEKLQHENARLRQANFMERQLHGRTVNELSHLREQVHHLDEMLSHNNDELQSVVPVFFGLEARSAALKQAETEIGQRAINLRLFCQDIERRYNRDKLISGHQAGAFENQAGFRQPQQYPHVANGYVAQQATQQGAGKSSG